MATVNLAEIMSKVATGEITPDDAAKMLAGTMKIRQQKPLTVEVNDKGNIRVGGFRQWPVGMTADEWEIVLAHQDEIRAKFDEARRQLLEYNSRPQTDETTETESVVTISEAA